MKMVAFETSSHHTPYHTKWKPYFTKSCNKISCCDPLHVVRNETENKTQLFTFYAPLVCDSPYTNIQRDNHASRQTFNFALEIAVAIGFVFYFDMN